jgi:hypothetical protein
LTEPKVTALDATDKRGARLQRAEEFFPIYGHADDYLVLGLVVRTREIRRLNILKDKAINKPGEAERIGSLIAAANKKELIASLAEASPAEVRAALNKWVQFCEHWSYVYLFPFVICCN